MTNRTPFNVVRGELEAECLPETIEFISSNLGFFHRIMKQVGEALDDDEGITFISNEERWSVACHLQKIELGHIVSATGVLIEGGRTPFDEVIAEIHQQ